MTYTVLEPHHCPSCGHELDAITRVAGTTQPTPGGVSICVYCSALNILQDDLTLRVPTPRELQHFLADPHVLKAIAYVERIRAAGGLQ